jgi:transcriptional regulator with XRE-family HTH domain
MQTQVAAGAKPAKKKVTNAHVVARRADERDAEVGRRVRTRRLEQHLSQTELADMIGVTFQQVQKYEKGVNRIGAGRLQRIAEALHVPMTYFFTEATSTSSDNKGKTMSVLLQSRGSVNLMEAFGKIANKRIQRLVVDLVGELAALSS